MLNPERLLGHLLSGGMRGRRARRKAAIGVGLLGVAIAAYEHYSQQRQAPAPSAGPEPAPDGPPPPPPRGGATPPPPPPEGSETRSEQAILLLQAMVAAAHADGDLDPAERTRILDKTREAGLSAEEISLIEQELSQPVALDQLASAASLYGIEGQVYAAALLAIEADTGAERTFLDDLAAALGIAADRRQRIHEQLGD